MRGRTCQLPPPATFTVSQSALRAADTVKVPGSRIGRRSLEMRYCSFNSDDRRLYHLVKADIITLTPFSLATASYLFQCLRQR
jgi:hypothetical protein